MSKKQILITIIVAIILIGGYFLFFNARPKSLKQKTLKHKKHFLILECLSVFCVFMS